MPKPNVVVSVLLGLTTLSGCAGQQLTAAGASQSSNDVAAGPSLAPAAVTIDAQGESGGVKFAPATIDIKSGDVVRLIDVGDTLHDFTIDVGGAVPAKPEDQHVAVQIKVDLANTTNQAAIDLPPGTYQFYCSVALGNGAGHATNGMVGTIKVR